MNVVIHPNYKIETSELLSIAKNFSNTGKMLADGKRNKIKLFPYHTSVLNVKAFKVPIVLNQIIYGYLRPSKAKRSFDYASILLNKGIGTPQPIAYIENKGIFGLKDSFYFSEHLKYDLTFRELITEPNRTDNELILRAFTRFCLELHDNGIEFKDHSPGNTLIIKNNENMYDFYLVDLNRMNFHDTLSFELRMKNLSRLTPKKEMIKVMSNEYAKFYTAYNEQQIFDLMWKETSMFQAKFQKKKALKKKLFNK